MLLPYILVIGIAGAGVVKIDDPGYKDATTCAAAKKQAVTAGFTAACIKRDLVAVLPPIDPPPPAPVADRLTDGEGGLLLASDGQPLLAQ